MKKLVSILLALVLTLALSISAFAANATVTIGNDADRDYVGFKLMNLTTSLKADDDCADGNHTEACYNYAYTINGDYNIRGLRNGNITSNVSGQGDGGVASCCIKGCLKSFYAINRYRTFSEYADAHAEYHAQYYQHRNKFFHNTFSFRNKNF